MDATRTQISNWSKIFDESFEDEPPAYGKPLWEPKPSSSNNRVAIGDVGYISAGEFHRVLNIKDERSSGGRKPPPLELATPKGQAGQSSVVVLKDPANVVSTGNDPAIKVTTSTSGSTLAPEIVEPITSKGVKYRDRVPGTGFKTYSFNTTTSSGAIIIPLSALEEQYLSPTLVPEWKSHMANNLNSWPESELCARRDLILIHGRVMASEWAIVVFDGVANLDPKFGTDFRVVIRDRTHPQDQIRDRASDGDLKRDSAEADNQTKAMVSIQSASGGSDQGDAASLPQDGILSADENKFHLKPHFRRRRDIMSTSQPAGVASPVPYHCLFYTGLKPTGNRGLLSGWTIEEVPSRRSGPLSPNPKDAATNV